MNPRSFLLLIVSMWILPLAAQQPDSLRVDSVPAARNWTPRAPLSPEEQQRRADKAAEMEAMRQRFRRFQLSEEEAARQRAAEAAAADFLWSEAEGAPQPADTLNTRRQDPAAPPNTENLRLEISRNLQVKGETESPAISPSPRSYDSLRTAVPPTSAWESRWQGEYDNAPPTPSEEVDTQWALELEQARKSANGPTAYTAGSVVPLEVNFSAGGTSLAPGLQPQLEEWLQILRSQPTLVLEIRAHAHLNLDHAAADQRSTRRAQAVMDYLVAQGVAPARLQARGYGKRAPLTYDISAAGQQQNERLEVIVLQH